MISPRACRRLSGHGPAGGRACVGAAPRPYRGRPPCSRRHAKSIRTRGVGRPVSSSRSSSNRSVSGSEILKFRTEHLHSVRVSLSQHARTQLPQRLAFLVLPIPALPCLAHPPHFDNDPGSWTERLHRPSSLLRSPGRSPCPHRRRRVGSDFAPERGNNADRRFSQSGMSTCLQGRTVGDDFRGVPLEEGGVHVAASGAQWTCPTIFMPGNGPGRATWQPGREQSWAQERAIYHAAHRTWMSTLQANLIPRRVVKAPVTMRSPGDRCFDLVGKPAALFSHPFEQQRNQCLFSSPQRALRTC